jgi:tartrate dehydrogenase/decarboxylase/D-malate dehydrogenase
MMLEFLGYKEAHDALVRAMEHVLVNGPRTPDMGGDASTTDVGEAIAACLAAS